MIAVGLDRVDINVETTCQSDFTKVCTICMALGEEEREKREGGRGVNESKRKERCPLLRDRLNQTRKGLTWPLPGAWNLELTIQSPEIGCQYECTHSPAVISEWQTT
jgi:hypothetical protein